MLLVCCAVLCCATLNIGSRSTTRRRSFLSCGWRCPDIRCLNTLLPLQVIFQGDKWQIVVLLWRWDDLGRLLDLIMPGATRDNFKACFYCNAQVTHVFDGGRPSTWYEITIHESLVLPTAHSLCCGRVGRTANPRRHCECSDMRWTTRPLVICCCCAKHWSCVFTDPLCLCSCLLLGVGECLWLSSLFHALSLGPPAVICGWTKRQGASQIYRRLLHPYLDKYEGNIDNGLEEMRAGATRRLHSLGASAASEIAKAVSRQGSSAVGPSHVRAMGGWTKG